MHGEVAQGPYKDGRMIETRPDPRSALARAPMQTAVRRGEYPWTPPLSPAEVAQYYGARIPSLRQNGVEWRSACPIHGGRNPSAFSVEAETGRWFCHSGCGAGGDVYALEMKLTGSPFHKARAAVDYIVGRCSQKEPSFLGLRLPAQPLRVDSVLDTGNPRKVDYALALWAETKPLAGTVAATYLKRRGLVSAGLDHVLRFHPRCPFGGDRLPCMVGLFRDIHTNEPCGIHRTALDQSGGKIGRMMLGRANGAAVKLTQQADVLGDLGIAEGIETALSVANGGRQAVWAVCSAGALKQFPVLDAWKSLTIWADHDPVGLASARNTAKRWSAAGKDACVKFPSIERTDFNDLLEADNA